MEFRGADSSLIVVVRFDECIFPQRGNERRWGNTIAIQICRTKVNGFSSTLWARQVFEALCRTLAPWYAHAEMMEEYHAKNISCERGGMAAVGVDVSRALPGLYWLNFFGKPYEELIGRDRLALCPGDEIKNLSLVSYYLLAKILSRG